MATKTTNPSVTKKPTSRLPSIRQIGMLCACLFTGMLSTAEAAPIFRGAFADELVFFNDGGVSGNEDLTGAAMLGSPDGVVTDLDGGAVTFGFSETSIAFDYEVGTLPEGTDLILVGAGILDIPGFIRFGYGIPVDSNSDGIADNATGLATRIGTDSGLSPSWSPNPGRPNLLYYDLDSSFLTVTGDFFVSVFDGNDLEIDSIQVITPIPEAVPAPASLYLISPLLIGLMGMARRAKPKHP